MGGERWGRVGLMWWVEMCVIGEGVGDRDVKSRGIYVEDMGKGKENCGNKKVLNEVLRKGWCCREVV